MATDQGDERSEPLLDAVDIEDRLHRVKVAALTGEPDRTGRVLRAAVGSACATTMVITYLWWRSRHRRAGRSARAPLLSRPGRSAAGLG